MIMMETSGIVSSIMVQTVAVWLIFRMIRLVHQRTAWIYLSVAIVLMAAQSVLTLPLLGISQVPDFSNLYALIDLMVLAFLVVGLMYIRKHLYDTFATERCMRENELRYRTLAQNIPNAAIFLFDHDHRCTLAAGGILQQLGFAGEQFEGKTIGKFPWPEEWTEIFTPIQEAGLFETSTVFRQPYLDQSFSIQLIPIINVRGTTTGTMVMILDITQQVKAEKERQAAYEFLQHTIDGVTEPVLVIDLDYQVKLMNRVVRENYVSSSESHPEVCYTLSHHGDTPCDDPSHPCPLQQIRATLMPVTVLHEHQTACGEVRQIEITASPLFDEQGQLKGIIESSLDVTDRKRAEDTLRESESIFRHFIEQSEDAIVLVDEQGLLIQWSKGAEKLTGFSRKESLGQPIWDIQFRSEPDETKTTEKYEQIKATTQIALRTGKGAFLNNLSEVVIRRRDGIHLSVQTLAFSIETERGFLLGSILRDVTERKHAEVELLRLRKAVEASGEVVFMTDRDGLITFVNPEFTRLYGYTAEEVIGRATPRILKSGRMQPEDYALFWQTILDKQVVRLELVNKTKDGQLLTIETAVNPILDETGSIEGFLAIQSDVTQRKQAERALENSERRFRALIENGVDYISLITPDGRLLWESPSTSLMLGYLENEFQGKNTLQLIHPNDLKWVRERFRLLISTPGAQDRASFRLRHHDGSWRWVEAVVTNLINEPSVEAIVINYHDVTERKKAEAEKSKLLSAISYAVDGIAITDKNDRYIYVNEAHAKIYGYSPNELIGKTWRFLVPKDAEEGTESRVNQILHNKKIGFIITEAPALRRDGSKSPTEIKANALWDEDGRYAGHICIVVDITHRKQAEEATRRRTEELETLTQVSAAMRAAQSQGEIFIAVLSQVMSLFDGEAASLSLFDSAFESAITKLGCGAWENWTGTNRPIYQGITGKVFATGQPYVTNDLPTDDLFEWAAEAGEVPCAVCLPLVTNQRMVGVLWLGRQYALSDKDVSLLTAIADMTANALQRQSLHEDLQAKLKTLQETQARLIQSEKLAAIGQLTSGIAHEVNNPLTSVVLHAQMLQRQPLGDNVKRDLEKVVVEALRASKIVRGLLDFARQRSPEVSPTNINDVLKSVVDLTSYEMHAHRVQYELDLAPDFPVILADAHQLQQVFINLVNNAWQAISETQKEGILRIKTELAPATPEINSRNDSMVIRIIIEDNGPGIPEEYISKVFDPFFSTKPEGKGTGLGLSICHGIISEHGGNIWVESVLGMGARFIVELPIVLPGRVDLDQADETSTEVKHIGNSRVLIIDDEANVREVLTRALRGKGYQVESVSNARQGLEKISQNDFSVILCDIRMPDINGQEFYWEVRSRNPELAKRIVFISGGAVKTKTQSLIEQKNVLYLTKPFELDELYRMVSSIEDGRTNELIQS